MRIKAVCELTELTDRTIRYYIEEQLITPTYKPAPLHTQYREPDDIVAVI